MKPFSDFNKQIETLENRNLTILDRKAANFALRNYGYYEIVNGYKIFLLDESKTVETFLEKETFEHLVSLYNLDKQIRNLVMQATLEVELSLRTALAYTLAEDFGILESDYLDRKKYNRGKFQHKHKKYQRDFLLDMLKDIAANRPVEPLNSYRIKHKHIPPWILFKETTLGNITNFIKILKGPQKDKIISLCTGLSSSQLTPADKTLFIEILDLILAFRNRAAHGGRMFNYKASASLSYHKKFHNQIKITPADYRNGKGQRDLYTFFHSLALFDNKAGFDLLELCLYSIKEHDASYPSDWLVLASEMGYPKDVLKTDLQRHRNFHKNYRWRYLWHAIKNIFKK